MHGDLIDLSTPRGTPAAVKQAVACEEEADVFSFWGKCDQMRPQQQQSPSSAAPKPQQASYSSVVQQQEASTPQSNAPVTPEACPHTQLECPPTAPLHIPATPATASIASRVEACAPSHHGQAPSTPPPAFNLEAAPETVSKEPAAQQPAAERAAEPEASICSNQAAAHSEDQQPSSSRDEGKQSAGSSGAQKELAETRLKLAKVEASRDSIARDLGHQKGSIAKLEGTVSCLDKRLKAQLQENQALKDRLAEAERAAAVANVTADVTPERCRLSVKAMHEEALRAHEVARQREAQVHKLQQLMAHEAEEMAQLHAFEAQERTMLLASQAALQQALSEQSNHVASLLEQQGESRGREAAMEAELHKLRKEVWDTKNQNIELMAEAQHIHGVATAAQAAANAAQAQIAVAQEAEAKSAAEVATIRDAGVKLFKQIRAVTHALERNLHHFQKVQEISLSIRQLHDWVAKHGPFWIEKSEEAVAAAEAGSAMHHGGPGAGPPPSGMRSQGQDETMTVSLKHVCAMGAGGGAH